MTFRLLPLSIITLGLCSSSLLFAADPTMKLSTEKDKISYSLGLDIGKNFTKQGIPLDPNVFMSGLEAGLQNKTSLMTEQEIRDTLGALQNKMTLQHQENMKKLSQTNLEEGKAFLEKNKKNPNVTTRSSGLQYRVITQGQGNAPTLQDTVKAHYSGKLLNGVEFDSSYARGEPIEIPVNGVIKGWTEVLQLMKPGAKWEVFIPANLAYGEAGAGNVIGPNATLVFEIELLSVLKATPTTASSETQKSSKTSKTTNKNTQTKH